jgi:hypothetical protein
MQLKKLPIGIQTFAKIREDDHYYVDKTPLALRLIDQGTHYFLSRPVATNINVPPQAAPC